MTDQQHQRGRRTGVRAAALAALAAGCAALAGCGSAGSTAAGSTAGGPASASGAHPVTLTVSGSPRAWSKERFEKALSEHGGTFHAAKATTSNARVGAIFSQGVDGDHFCTASVVHSAAGDLLVTAAHCVHGGQGGSYGSDLVFVPDYRDGSAPDGQWPVTRIVVDPRWISSSDPDLDVAFVTVGQVGGRSIEQVLGGNTLGIDKGFTKVVQITGYPSTASAPISCFNRTTQQSQYQMRIACTGFPGGTSGSPWLTSFDRTTRTGTVIGVIGGYQQGGDTADVSYSPYFDADVQTLYNEAAGQGS
ncbi:trypsin-like serine peptidase [Streptacidiphilus albus]|uniref:trypsin-like serine peptidase n=1 Tax=Streptacidiphilus albus TaxID=105425 RepID=UPI000A5BC5ED|nr:serine protease [Streptacidiphilus albus]